MVVVVVGKENSSEGCGAQQTGTFKTQVSGPQGGGDLRLSAKEVSKLLQAG